MKALLCSLLLVMSLSVFSKEAIKGPVFTDYGPVFKAEDRDRPLKKDFTYKVVFDVTKTGNELDQLSRRLESVARFINMHALNGVKLENMDIAVVLHGAATKDGVNHQAYQKKHKSDNPNLDLIEQLHSKGVKFYVCAQSAYFYGFEKKDYVPQVKIALSAMTTLAELQSEGYALLP